MNCYRCDYGNQAVTIEAATAEEAAREYVETGLWGEVTSTTWINVYVEEVDEDDELVEGGERERIKVALNPDAPECMEGEGASHVWRSPRFLGGCEQNPGVWGHGAGVLIRECCVRCGCERETDTWAQDRETGEQGLESVSYEPRKWLEEIDALAREGS